MIRKSLLLLSVMLVVITGCASAIKKQSDDITLTYEAITRGSNLIITAQHDSLTVKSVNGNTNFKKAMKSEDWKGLVNELEKIDLKTINELKAPSNKRFYDGAAIGALTVQLKDTLYRSSSFDHGNPPAEIKAIVDKITGLSDIVKRKD